MTHLSDHPTILDQETITWISVQDQIPDENTTVFVYCPIDECEPVWLGWFEGGVWRSVDAQEYERDSVTAWAVMPVGPRGRS